MSLSQCVLCGVVSDTLAPDGLCATCHERSAQTRAADADARTLTRDPQGDTTRTDGGSGELAGLLPPGGYKYLDEVDGGGMGLVYKAVQVSTGRTVAIKKLKPDRYTPGGLRRFVIEAQTLARVEHENVVRLHDFVTDAGDPFIVMDFVPGDSLGKHLKLVGPLHPDRAARLTAAAARGVQAAHDNGVVHRDLKPANLLLTPDGRVKVVDFGLGKLTGDAEVPAGESSPTTHSDTITRPGQTAGGTPGFMAPEQVDPARGPIDRAADVWGLGACLYALLTGKTPFPTGQSEMGRVLTDPLVPPHEVNSTVPADLSAIACKCLQKDPAARYPSAADVADDLGRYLSRDITTARPRPLPVRVWQRLRHTPRAVVIAVAVAVLAVAVGVSLALLPKRSEPPVVTAPPDPVDEHARMREQFLAGEEVAIVPETGLPKWHEWVVGKADVTDSPARDGSAYIRPFGVGAVKLFDPPGDRYRLSVDLCHLSPQDEADVENTWAGLMLFHRRAERADGAWADSYLLLTYRDWDQRLLNGRPPTPQLLTPSIGYQFTDRPGGRSATGGTNLSGLGVTFDTGAAPAGRWRRIVAEVTPARVRLFWGDPDAGDAGLTVVADLSAAEMNQAYAGVQTVLRVKAARPPVPAGPEASVDPTLIPAGWSPVGGIGLYVTRSGLAFRKVNVRSIPPTPED